MHCWRLAKQSSSSGSWWLVRSRYLFSTGNHVFDNRRLKGKRAGGRGSRPIGQTLRCGSLPACVSNHVPYPGACFSRFLRTFELFASLPDLTIPSPRRARQASDASAAWSLEWRGVMRARGIECVGATPIHGSAVSRPGLHPGEVIAQSGMARVHEPGECGKFQREHHLDVGRAELRARSITSCHPPSSANH